MNYIPMSDLKYSFNDQGETTEINVSYRSFESGNNFNSQVTLTSDYVQSVNDKLTLDNMNKDQCDNIARRYLREWLNVEEPKEKQNSSGEESTN